MTDTSDCEISVPAAELAATLRRLLKLGGKTPGPGIWRIDPGELTVEWKGGVEGIEGSGKCSVAFRIEAKAMKTLAKTIAKKGTLRIRVRDDDHVSFDTYAVPCRPVGPEASDLLPVHAERRDVLMLGFTHDHATIENAGLSSAVAGAREELVTSVRAAADELAWTGVSPELLHLWVQAHIEAVARGKRSFEIVRGPVGQGQLDLFRD